MRNRYTVPGNLPEISLPPRCSRRCGLRGIEGDVRSRRIGHDHRRRRFGRPGLSDSAEPKRQMANDNRQTSFAGCSVMEIDAKALQFRASLSPAGQELFNDRRMSATVAQISYLAEEVWQDAELGPMFRRLGVDGKMEVPQLNEYVVLNPEKPWVVEPKMSGNTEWHRTWKFLDGHRVGDMWGLYFLDIWLATGLCRERADGKIADFREGSTESYILDRRGYDKNCPYKIKPHSANVIIKLSHEMVNDKKFRHFLENDADSLQDTDFDKFSSIVKSFIDWYKYRYCYFNRSFQFSLDIARKYIEMGGDLGCEGGDVQSNGWEVQYLSKVDPLVRAWLEDTK